MSSGTGNNQAGNNSSNEGFTFRTEPNGLITIVFNSDGENKVVSEPKIKRKCWVQECKRKLPLIACRCRCGGEFCEIHRYSDRHGCPVDYKSLGAEDIRKNNPLVIPDKIKKI